MSSRLCVRECDTKVVWQAPFDGATDTERLNAVKRGIFSYPITAALSADATNFINGLLQMNPAKRLTARAVSVALLCLYSRPAADAVSVARLSLGKRLIVHVVSVARLLCRHARCFYFH